MLIQITEAQGGLWSIVSLTGRIDNNTAPELKVRLLPCIAGLHTGVIIDLGGVDYISSAGVRVLIMAAKEQQAKQSSLILCNLSSELKEFFNLAGVNSVFTIVSKLPEALLAKP